MRPSLASVSAPRTSGSAILVVLIVLAIMSILLVANGRTAWQLHQELRIIEQQQIKRCTAISGNPRPKPMPIIPAPAEP